jgi:hypothetical protein
VKNISTLVRGTNGRAVNTESDCADLIMWYVECTDRRVVETKLTVVADDGREIAISIPSSQSRKVDVRVQPEPARNYCCAF